MLRVLRHLWLNSVKCDQKMHCLCSSAISRVRSAKSLSTSTPGDRKPDAFEERPQFPGSRSDWTQELRFIDPTNYEGIPVFRVVDKNGNIFGRELKSLHEKFDKDFLQKLYRGLSLALFLSFMNN